MRGDASDIAGSSALGWHLNGAHNICFPRGRAPSKPAQLRQEDMADEDRRGRPRGTASISR